MSSIECEALSKAISALYAIARTLDDHELRAYARDAYEAANSAYAEAVFHGGEKYLMLNEDLSVWKNRALVAEKELRSKSAVSQGWKLVPIEPTREMSSAGRLVLKGAADEFEFVQAECAYKAMIAAAPSPDGGGK